jgi:hypothetical protein
MHKLQGRVAVVAGATRGAASPGGWVKPVPAKDV